MSGADNIMEEATGVNVNDDPQLVKQLRFNLKTGVKFRFNRVGSRSLECLWLGGTRRNSHDSQHHWQWRLLWLSKLVTTVPKLNRFWGGGDSGGHLIEEKTCVKEQARGSGRDQGRRRCCSASGFQSKSWQHIAGQRPDATAIPQDKEERLQHPDYGR